MNDFTPLARPLQSQISIDSVAKDCLSPGFNFPTFRQLAKNVRILISKPLNPQLSTPYHRLFSIANSKGWFVAVKATPSGSGSEIIFSPLDELRTACEGAKPGDESLYNPKRTLSIPTKANIVAFACGDTKLLIGLEDGSVIVYDTSSLFIPGNNDVQPLGRTQLQSSPFRQVLPNPGIEPNLSDLFAVVGDGKVHLLDMQLQSQGGWEASDLMTQPIAVDWSPKGKHIAIGLQTGDILTFSLTNKSTPHKHIPPTVNSLLVSLNWLAPGHTFRTSYQAIDGTATQHIIVLDTKSSSATYFAPDHPFLSGDRKDQAAYVLVLPKWDADSPTNDENKYLTVVADLSSVDLEVLGNNGNRWYRHSQDNPLTLPLDKDMVDDTMILALQVDLTDSRYDSPIMYAYLNDGSLQGWYVEHTKPYLGMMNGKALGTTDTNSQMTADTQERAKDTDMGGTTFGQISAPSSNFGQSSFGQPSSSPFGVQATSAFGQKGFGQQPDPISSPFGQSSSTAPTFGQSSFGQPPVFGGLSNGGFGQSNQPTTTESAFSSPASGSGFSSFASATGTFGTSPFGSGSTPNAFSGLGSNSNTNVFGQGSFGTTSNPASGEASPSRSQPEMTREASMSDSTPGFGGMSLGSAHPTDPSAVNSMFGGFSGTTNSGSTPSSSSTFGGSIVKPASGAFGNVQTSSAFSSNKLPNTVSTFAPVAESQPAASPAFGQSGFGQPSFGQPSFGKPSFGAGPTTSGFGTSGNSSQQQTPAATSGGFGAFASTPTTFGSALGSTKNNADSKPATGGGFSAFTSTTPSAFGSTQSDAVSKPSPSTGGGFNAFASNAHSAFGSAADGAASKRESNTGNGFNSFTSTTSVFGSNDSTTTTEPKSRISVFGTPTTTSSTSLGASAVRSSFGNTRNDSPTGSPKDSFDNSPPSSPESKPAVVSPFGNATSPSPFGQAAKPVPSSGAFGNIQVTPSVFKPASGFGAFGSAETPKNSVFFKKPDEAPPPISSFGSTSTAPKTPSTAAPNPTFGSPSVLGGAKSPFAPTTPTAQTPTKAPTSGGFSAFSGGSTGFSAFAGPKTSFTDLLKSGGEELTDPVKPSASGTSKPESEAESSKPPTSVLDVPSTPKQDKLTVVSAFPPIAKSEDTESNLSVPTPSTTPKREVVSAFSPISKNEDTGSTSDLEDNKAGFFASQSKADDKKPAKIIQDEPSYGNLSVSSAGSSFVEVGAEQDEEPNQSDEEGDAAGEEGEENEEDPSHSDSNSFLSDDFEESEYKDGDSANEESDGEELPEERTTPSPEPPLSVSRSPSATPQPELPIIQVSPSADEDEEESPSSSPRASPIREASTTPPSTPVKEPKSLFGQAPSLATPGTPSSSPFGLGLGRPSTRPTRSSPLANAVSVEEDDEEKTKVSPKPHPRALSPRPVYGVLPVEEKTKSKEKGEPTAESSTVSNKRPKTPPLLSTMGPPVSIHIPKTPVLAPAVTPGSKTPSASLDATPIKSSTHGPASFGFGSQPAAAVSSPSLFGNSKPSEGSPFGAWSTTTPSNPELPRAQTAPAAAGSTSLFGGPTTPGMTSLFGVPPPAIKSPSTPPFSMPAFTLNPPVSHGSAPTPTPMFHLGAPSPFGSKSPPMTPSGPSLFGGMPASPSTGSLFGPKQTAPSPSVFGSPHPSAIQPLASPPFSFGSKTKTFPPTTVQSPPKQSPTAALEEGMQKECANLVTMLNEDLGRLSELAIIASRAMATSGKPAGGSRNKKELSIASKWSLGDLNQFSKLILQYEADLESLEAHRKKQREMIRELHSSMLKCGTRKEEIARFNKARNDKEFAKMLKSRTLGPEHTETQTRLRKDIRAVRDRVQKLETRLQENKKKLAQAASCKPSIKAPSLDTINRTYRNIEITIDQQADEVSRLASRISKLNVNSRPNTPTIRDARLPDVEKRRAYRVTPNVAATTAAALNAERSANRLKKALLSVRKEPLLNTKAAVARSAPISFKTPKRKTSGGIMGDFEFQTPTSGSLFGEVSPESSASIPDWDLPEDNFNPTETPALAGRRGATGQRKHPSVPLKRNPGTAPPAPPTDFQWGPLPSFSTPPPAKNLPASFVSFSTPTKK